jgi:cysteine desulfurase
MKTGSLLEKTPIYFDNSATTRLSKDVLAEMMPFLTDQFGNANSNHFLGQHSALAVKAARVMIAKALSCKPNEVFFTSGGTEADNWVLRSALTTANIRGKTHFVASAVEHKAILATLHDLETKQGCEFTLLPVDGQGRVNPDDLRRAVKSNTKLVTVMAANNETGTIQPIGDIYKTCKELGVLFHTDAVQTLGKYPLSATYADMISLSAHKVNGPTGIGALVIRSGTPIAPFLLGGAQEDGLRAGTTPTASVVGFGKAVHDAVGSLSGTMDHLLNLGSALEEGIVESIPDVSVNGFPAMRLPGLVNVCFRGIEAQTMVSMLSQRHGVCCSSGSACSEKSVTPSYVLRACGLSVADCHSSVRFSLGRYNTMDEVTLALKAISSVAQELRRGF